MLFCSSYIINKRTAKLWKWKCFSLSPVRLWDPMDCSPPASVHGILQARILEWVAISFSRGCHSQARDRTWVPCTSWILYHLSHQGRIIALLLIIIYLFWLKDMEQSSNTVIVSFGGVSETTRFWLASYWLLFHDFICSFFFLWQTSKCWIALGISLWLPSCLHKPY